ncbi:glutamate-1-semialdehyde 2,1-aminomutase [Helicobacter kayseriensis]|uniref:glutamate-1-semialdehyde 2,1-aminomutase n=1 Tax=Helicobacter kayseriensis TaxID=2905877 RepID=UPI001E29C22A|nr:glutamate-1-semialdehyde 2,1-aminomutase [Helicobacter kayseriensis]MCE3046662.1 glutamate-1-semialdehyde 2,1-aminomutase [Helicobacter kayseriensis]MCE3048036.1 glutamate-1-semialdehyde 2,1-aminomutase [Helicobacter kayseriensis]
MNFEKSNQWRIKAKNLIPGGGHTYSKGDDQFPALSPFAIQKGLGARVWDIDGNEFVDWGMGLGSVLLGHAFPPVVEVVQQELQNGCNFIRPSFIEAEVAELLANTIPCAEMVKFAKNGSNATSAAVKLARAYTGKEVILRCKDHAFFSIDDWFMGNTAVNAGIPKSVQVLTDSFGYNDPQSLIEKINYHQNNVACVILEPAATCEPQDNFLQKVREICTQYGIVLIFDEVVSGFRFHPKGAQYLYGVTPDLASFGKAMANGFSISALTGKKEIMERGGIDHPYERVFLLSTTYGGETHHLRAAQKTLQLLLQDDYAITKHIWQTGKTIKEAYNQIARELGISDFTKAEGIDCRPYFSFTNTLGEQDPFLRTLFMQEMIKSGVLLQVIIPSYSHRDSEISQTIEGFEKSLKVIAQAIEKGNTKELLVGNETKPVFRKYN